MKETKAVADESKTPAVRKIEWKFTVDRFGVRAEPGGNESKVDFARKAVTSISAWFKAIDLLYGNGSEALTLATSAGLLPQYPYWQSVKQAAESLESWLAPEGQRVGGTDVSAVRPNRSPAIGEKIVEPRNQDLVEQLRLYLEGMQRLAPVFRGVTWAASIAGCGSRAALAQERLLQGLRSVSAVYEFDARQDANVALARFTGTLPSLLGHEAPLGPLFQSFHKQGQSVLQYTASPPHFASNPDDFRRWVAGVLDAAESYPHQRSTIPAAAWESLEDAYWSQWKWPSIGAVSRVGDAPTAASASGGGGESDSAGVGEVSALDLIYTTRYGSLPLLHWRGGNLSICQWSRILNVASLRSTTALQAPGATGFANLGFGESENRTDGKSDPKSDGPIVMIAPISERSAVWTWSPEKNTRAFALVPRALAESDAAASQPAEKAQRPARDWLKEAAAAAQREQHATPLLHFMEVVGDEVADDSPVSERLPWAPWRRIGFSLNQDKGPLRYFIPRPRNLLELVERTIDRFPDFFPAPADEIDSVIGRIFYSLGRFVRSTGYTFQQFAAALNRSWRQLISLFRLIGESYMRR